MEEQFIGNYKILRKIGTGGMAKVYLAVHRDIPNLKVVLKILSDPRLAERFRQEADKLALLDNNPNICRIKHFFNHGEDFVIAMDFIDGINVDEQLKAGGKFPIAESLRIITSVLEILDSAHQKDIYHRDIKPSNIMIDREGNVKVIDFGIAKSKDDPTLTMAGTACGTPAYMAPEQFTDAQTVDYTLVDIYATGTTLFHLVTGELPFKGENPFLIRDAKITTDPPLPRKINPEISRGLEAVIIRSLNRNPTDRYQSARQMKEALLALPEMREEGPAVETPTIVPDEMGKKKRSRFPIAIVAIIIVAAAAFLVYKLIVTEKKPAQVSDTMTPLVTPDTASKPADITATPIQNGEVPKGTIVLKVIPSGDLFLDGTVIGRNISDTFFARDTGMYILRVENSRAVQKTIIDTIRVTALTRLLRRYTFDISKPVEAASRPTAASGKVAIGSIPRGGSIYIDGKIQLQETPYTYTLDAGQHIIMIILDRGGQSLSYVDTVTISGDSLQKVFFNAE